MAHFAELDENNIVLQVTVVNNSDILDENGNESEEIGIQFNKNLLGQDTKWVQTSYNSNFRYKYAGIGDFYDLDDVEVDYRGLIWHPDFDVDSIKDEEKYYVFSIIFLVLEVTLLDTLLNNTL